MDHPSAGGAESGAVSREVVVADDLDETLWEVVQAWPKLDDVLRQSILIAIRFAEDQR